MITVMARAAVRPDQADAMASLMRGVCAESRKEAACIAYDVYQDAADPTRFGTVEVWRDQASVDAHMTTPHVTALFARLPEMVTGAPEIVSFNKLT